jgi:hypothetical protein
MRPRASSTTSGRMRADLGIWRAAAILMQRHDADDAALVAAQRAGELRAKGDLGLLCSFALPVFVVALRLPLVGT